jgi:hypothetical protein
MKKGILVISLEMPANQIIDRLGLKNDALHTLNPKRP